MVRFRGRRPLSGGLAVYNLRTYPKSFYEKTACNYVTIANRGNVRDGAPGDTFRFLFGGWLRARDTAFKEFDLAVVV
jgi:hypothetical protein